MGNELLATQPLTSWEAAVGQFAGQQRTFVVLDEFQLLAAQSPELETVLSRWWRRTGRTLPLVLVLAGSELSFFENEVIHWVWSDEASSTHSSVTPRSRLRAIRASRYWSAEARTVYGA